MVVGIKDVALATCFQIRIQIAFDICEKMPFLRVKFLLETGRIKFAVKCFSKFLCDLGQILLNLGSQLFVFFLSVEILREDAVDLCSVKDTDDEVSGLNCVVRKRQEVLIDEIMQISVIFFTRHPVPHESDGDSSWVGFVINEIAGAVPGFDETRHDADHQVIVEVHGILFAVVGEFSIVT